MTARRHVAHDRRAFRHEQLLADFQSADDALQVGGERGRTLGGVDVERDQKWVHVDVRLSSLSRHAQCFDVSNEPVRSAKRAIRWRVM